MAETIPVQTYIPSCWVRLVVRFEDFGAKDIPATPKQPPQARKGSGKPDDVLDIVEENGILVLSTGDQSHFGSPEEQQLSQDGRTFPIDGIIPASASWSQNGLREADTLNLTLRYKDLPVDPRTVRGCAVKFYLGTVTPEDFERGVNGETRGGGPMSGMPLSLCSKTFSYDGSQRSTLRFQGWVDSWQVDWTDNEEPIARLECTDTTRILLEQNAPPAKVINPKKPIDRAIAEYLANFPQYLGIGVVYEPAGLEIPGLNGILKPAKKKEAQGLVPVGDKASVWDYITDVAKAIGHSARFDIRFDSNGNGIPTVVIQRARTIYKGTLPSRVGDSFDEKEKDKRTQRINRSLPNRLMVYGRNIESMSIQRDYARHAAQNVEVRAYSEFRKKTIIARFPEIGQRVSRPMPGDQNDQKWNLIELGVPVRDEAVLKILAQEAYETIGRRELEVSITTKNMASFGGGNELPDLLDVRAGDAIDVEVSKAVDGEDTSQSTVNEIEALQTATASSTLRDKGFSDDFAAAYGKAITNIGLPRTFRVRETTIDWDADEGVSLVLGLSNYTEIRADKSLFDGQEPTAEDVAGARQNDTKTVSSA